MSIFAALKNHNKQLSAHCASETKMCYAHRMTFLRGPSFDCLIEHRNIRWNLEVWALINHHCNWHGFWCYFWFFYCFTGIQYSFSLLRWVTAQRDPQSTKPRRPPPPSNSQNRRGKPYGGPPHASHHSSATNPASGPTKAVKTRLRSRGIPVDKPFAAPQCRRAGRCLYHSEGKTGLLWWFWVVFCQVWIIIGVGFHNKRHKVWTFCWLNH